MGRGSERAGRTAIVIPSASKDAPWLRCFDGRAAVCVADDIHVLTDLSATERAVSTCLVTRAGCWPRGDLRGAPVETCIGFESLRGELTSNGGWPSIVDHLLSRPLADPVHWDLRFDPQDVTGLGRLRLAYERAPGWPPPRGSVAEAYDLLRVQLIFGEAQRVLFEADPVRGAFICGLEQLPEHSDLLACDHAELRMLAQLVARAVL